MGAITNDTFNPIRGYSNVRLQQGVPLVDADVNELDDIRKFDLRALLKFALGNGLRLGGDGFRILPAATNQATDVLISAGGNAGNNTTYTHTTATYPQPTNVNPLPTNNAVSVTVASNAGLSVNQYVAIVQADGLFAGLYQVTALPAGQVTLGRPQYGPGLPTSTTVTTGAKIFLASSDVTTTGLNNVGRLLIDGQEVVIPCDRLFSEQVLPTVDTKPPNPTPAIATSIPAATQVLLFLDVWDRVASTAEDPSLIVQPLNIETSVRNRRVWVVRARDTSVHPGLPVQGNSDWAPGHYYYPLAMINRGSPGANITASDITDLRESGTLVGPIEQPPLPLPSTGMWLLLDSNAQNWPGTHLRVYNDGLSIYFILNASWNGSNWVPDDVNTHVSGFSFNFFSFTFFNHDPTSTPFNSFQRTWMLHMYNTIGLSNTGSGFMTTGNVHEIGRIGFWGQNTGSTTQNISTVSVITFRNSFPTASVSSITFSSTVDTFNTTSGPIAYVVDENGFAAYVQNSSLAAGGSFEWQGSYTVIG
jgi:hypothetical protein